MRLISPFLLLISAVLFGGCDTFRSLAGRPTSAEIEAKREAIAQLKSAQGETHEEHIRTLRTAEQEISDSVASVEGLRRVPRFSAERVGIAERPSHRLYIVIGMYSTDENARRAASLMESQGYPAEIIGYKSGKRAVGVCGSNKIGELYESFTRFSDEPYCPEGVWILVNE